jgi:hypothetical protein
LEGEIKVARPLEHILDYTGYSYPKPLKTVYYGQCTRSPYTQNSLWFVTIHRGCHWQKLGPPDYLNPEDDHTFLVDKQYAHPTIMDQWKRDINKWNEVAHKVFVGSWCAHYECLWIDVPVFKHQLLDGNVVKYGYCRTQSSRNPDRELWYVAFRSGPTFVVDHTCAQPNFIDHMGSDMLKWEIICWCRLEDEVVWDELVTGKEGGGYVRTHTFALDSPYLPFSLQDVEVRVQTYEQEVQKLIERYKLDGKRPFLSKTSRPDWNQMGQDARYRFIRRWERETGQSIIPIR